MDRDTLLTYTEPINKKMESITNMNPPTSRKEVRKSIGVIILYRNMWPSRLHIAV